MSFQNVADGFIADRVAQLDEFAFNLPVTPVILACQAQNQLLDLPRGPRSTCAGYLRRPA